MMVNRRRSSTSSSSSSSSDEEKYALPSVKNLASKFNTLSKGVESWKKSSVKKSNQSSPTQKPHNISNGSLQRTKIIDSKNTININNTKPVRKWQIHPSGTKKPEIVNAPKKNGRKYSSSSDSDDVFVKSSSSKGNAVSITERVTDKNVVKQSPVTYVKPESDVNVSTVVFGVKLRSLDKTSWGVMQKRAVSPKNNYDLQDFLDDGPLSPRSPFSESSESKFASFSKTAPAYNSLEQSSSNTLPRKAGGVKGKIASQKLGNKMGIQYHSYSDLSEINPSAQTARRKSFSEDYMEMHQPLTRSTSISDLLKLYRTKSQSDLTQIDNDAPSMSSTVVKKVSVEEKSVKTLSTVSAPLTMNDVKICTPMTNKPLPYKPAVKDIVRLRTPVTIKQHTVPSSAERKLSSSSESSDDNGKTYTSGKTDKLQVQENKIPSDTNSKRLTAILTPDPYSGNRGYNQKALDIFKEVREERERASRPLHDNDPINVQKEKESPLVEKPKVEKMEEAVKHSYTKVSNEEPMKKSKPTFKAPPLRRTNSISSLIDALNENKGFQNKDVSSSSSESSDEADMIPHDDKVASFIVTKPASLPPKSSNFMPYKTAERNKQETKIPVVKYSQQSKAPLKKTNLSNDEPDIARDEPIPYFTVSKFSSQSASQFAEPKTINSSAKPSTNDMSSGVHNASANNKKFSFDKPSSSDQSDSDDIPESKKIGSYDVTKEGSVHFDLKPRIIKDIPKSRFAGTTSESSQDESKNPKRSALRNSFGQSLDSSTTKKKTSASKPKFTVEVNDQYVNYKPDKSVNDIKSRSSSSEEDASKNKSRIPIFTAFKKNQTSSSEDDQSTPRLRSFKEHHTDYTLTSNKPNKNMKSQTKKDRSDDETSESTSEPFTDFDPFAIGRMIVRGARKRDSNVKRPENYTPIVNATVPVNSPFSPVKSSTLEKKVNVKTTVSRRKSSTSSSSSSDEDSLAYLDAKEHSGGDGVYSANIAIIN